MKKLILLVLMCCFTGAVMAQYIDMVHLKNGSMIKGVIIEQTPNESLKIQTSDGSIFVYLYDEILKITKEVPKNQVFTSEKSSRYMGMIDIGHSFEVTDTDEWIVYDYLNRFDISTSHGCLAMPYLYIGAGLGFHYYYDIDQFNIPFFADFRAYPIKGNIKPFLNFRIGYAVGDIKGLYLMPSLGVSIYRFDISLGYTRQHTQITDYYDDSLVSQAVTFKLGLRF